jgi:glycosyltransferase involved in cell wall biosynthesis
MRILYVNHNTVGSGTYNRAFHLAREMVRRGHELTLVTTSRSARVRARWTEREGVQVLESPDLLWGRGRTGWDPYNVLRRIWALQGSPFEIVHAFDCRPAVIFPALAAARGSATVLIDWADWWGRGGTIAERSGWLVRSLFGPIETWFEESFRTRAAGATVISAALRERCMALGVPREWVLQLPNGCSQPEAQPIERAEARASLGLNEQPLLVHLGTALPGDAKLMFEALRRARAQDPRVRLVLVGGFRSPLPEDLAADGVVMATGLLPAEAVGLWLASADACVAVLRDSTASRGRWPSKVNDYFTAGRATVMTEVSDVAAYVRDGRAGLVCAPDADALAAAMLQMVQDDALRSAAEASALSLAELALPWRTIAAKLDGFYADVLHRASRPLAASA